MRKLLLILLACAWPASAERLGATYNPTFGGPDYYTRIDTNTIIPGTNVTITCTNGACTVNSAGGSGSGVAILPLPAGATNYIQNTSSLQSGATFYVSSGTVNGQVNVYQGMVVVSTNQASGIITNGIMTLHNTNTGAGDWYIPIKFVNGALGNTGWQFGAKGGLSPTGFFWADNGSILARLNTALSNSQFVKTDSAQALVSYDLLNATQTWTGQNTFTAQVTVSTSIWANGSAGTSGQVLSSQGPGGVVKWIDQTAGGGGASSLEVMVAGVRITSPTATEAYSSDFTGTPTGSTATIGMSSLNRTINTLTSSFTVLGDGGISVVSSSAGQVGLTEGAASTLTTVGSGKDVLYADSTANAFKIINNNGLSGLVVVASTNTTAINYTVVGTDFYLSADASGGAITVTLPTAVGRHGKIYHVKMKSATSTTNTVTVATTASQTIDGATTQILTLQYTDLPVISDGANWSIL